MSTRATCTVKEQEHETILRGKSTQAGKSLADSHMCKPACNCTNSEPQSGRCTLLSCFCLQLSGLYNRGAREKIATEQTSTLENELLAQNSMSQLTEENQSLWRIKNNYKKDAQNDKEAIDFWNYLEKDKQDHIKKLTELPEKRIRTQ